MSALTNADAIPTQRSTSNEPHFRCGDCGAHAALKPSCRTCKGKGWVK